MDEEKEFNKEKFNLAIQEACVRESILNPDDEVIEGITTTYLIEKDSYTLKIYEHIKKEGSYFIND